MSNKNIGVQDWLDFRDGWIPDRVQAQEAALAGEKSDREKLLELAAPWDAEDVPPVTGWNTYAAWLDANANLENPPKKDWTTIADVDKYFTASQSSRPNCAGFGMANAAMVTLLNQCVRGSEQLPKKLNPMLTWLISKGGSAYRGQTISAIAQAGNEYGNYLAEDVGEYTTSTSCYSKRNKFSEHAKQHQVGISLYDGSEKDLPGYIIKSLALPVPRAVILGNGFSVTSNPKKDENGVPCVCIDGTWSHATAAVKYFIINGKKYVAVMNSHDRRYEAFMGIPDFCFILPYEDFITYMSSSFSDAAFITYSEALYDTTLNPSLIPGK